MVVISWRHLHEDSTRSLSEVIGRRSKDTHMDREEPHGTMPISPRSRCLSFQWHERQDRASTPRSEKQISMETPASVRLGMSQRVTARSQIYQAFSNQEVFCFFREHWLCVLCEGDPCEGQARIISQTWACGHVYGTELCSYLEGQACLMLTFYYHHISTRFHNYK